MNDKPTLDPNPTPEETTTVEAETQAEAPAETQKTMPPLSVERVTDITFGLGKAAVDILDQAARQLDDSVRQIRQDTPGFLAEMEEKGRPVREKLSESLKGFSITDAFNKVTRPSDGPAAGDPAAFDDIEALENRVRELEQQVSTEPTVATPDPEKATEPSPFSMLELDDEPVVEPAPAAKPKPARKPAAPKVAKSATAEGTEKKPATPRTRKKPEGEAAG
jgi:hypothetical protein